MERPIAFVFGKNTEVRVSCSLTWRGEHFVFGGLKGGPVCIQASFQQGFNHAAIVEADRH